MITSYKRFAVALSTAVLALAVPNIAVAQPTATFAAPQEITVEIVTEYFGIEVTVCVGQAC